MAREPVTDSAVLTAALDYARRGWPVFPVYSIADGRCTCGGDTCTSPGKHPLTHHGNLDATTAEGNIRAWWATWPDANVAIATGAVSGVDVLDLDPLKGGFASRDMLEQRIGVLPTTLAVRTGSGGLHLYFAHADNVKNTVKLAGLFDGIDVRGDGGYVVAPPSLHASGAHYLWTLPLTTPIVPWPGALLPLVASPRREPIPRSNNGSTPDTIREGERNSTLTKWGGALQHAGSPLRVIEAALLAINQSSCTPPLPEAEVRRIAASVRRYPANVSRPLITLRRARDVEAPPVESHVEGLIPAGMLSILSGRDGLGKTLLALETAKATLFGVPFLRRFPTRQGAVVALLLDDPPSLVIERLERMGIREHPGLWLATSDDVDLADPIAMLEVLEAHAIERNAKLIIVDALYCLMPTSADAGNDAARMRPVLDALNRLAERTGAAVKLIAHDRKDGTDVAGSYVIRAACKVILRLVLPKGADDDPDEGPITPERVLQLNKTKLARPTAYRLRLQGPGNWDLHGTQQEHRVRERADERDTLRTAVLHALDTLGEATVDDIRREAGHGTNEVRSMLNDLVNEGVLQRTTTTPEAGHRGRPRVGYRRRVGNSSENPRASENPA